MAILCKRWLLTGFVGLLLGFTGLFPALAATQSAVACDAPGVSASATRLLVTVTHIRYSGGNVTLTLYGDDPAKFLAHRGGLALIRVPVTANAIMACFALSGPGTYAVAVYDDARNHHHFDTTFIGLPADDYGFSNNPRIILAPPGLHAAAFTVPAGGTHITIALHS